MKRVLFVSRDFKEKKINGGNEVAKRNFQLLSGVYDIDQISLNVNLSLVDRLRYLLNLNTFGFSKKIKIQIKKLITENEYEFVWIDSSLYGSISKYIKSLNSKLKVVTFFHNVEYLYYKDKMKVDGLINIIMLPYSMVNEKRIIKYSDKIIVLNSRDGEKLKKIYERGSDITLPLTLNDKYKEEYKNYTTISMPNRALFVGTNFFANVQGINWFIEEVLPEIDIQVVIVGQGMEVLKEKYKDNSKVEVLGFVDDIGLEYAKADYVIAPIFYGSGMKTKTTEALMYGKTIFGTPEAFEGFELDCEKVGGVFKNKEEFLNKIKKSVEKYNNYSREVYINQYSNTAIKDQVEKI